MGASTSGRARRRLASKAWALFDLFRRWNQSGFPFEGRDKRGAVDPVNILLNFGYALVARELDGLVESAGLDPAAGFYHQPHHDRPSLACDLLEEFRHGLVDRLVIRLINTRVIEADDFEDHGERGVRFANAGIRKFVTAYEKGVGGWRRTTGHAAPVSGAVGSSAGLHPRRIRLPQPHRGECLMLYVVSYDIIDDRVRTVSGPARFRDGYKMMFSNA
ncbi:MAG: CRISPR-associated endonuclease Cas1 [Bryobacteraceae bacterium]